MRQSVSIPTAWSQVLDFFGTPLVISSSRHRAVAGSAVRLRRAAPHPPIRRTHRADAGLRRGRGRSPRHRPHGAKPLREDPRPRRWHPRWLPRPGRPRQPIGLRSGAAFWSGRKEQECRTSRASVGYTSARIAIPPNCVGHIDRGPHRHLRCRATCSLFPDGFTVRGRAVCRSRLAPQRQRCSAAHRQQPCGHQRAQLRGMETVVIDRRRRAASPRPRSATGARASRS
jgi:hypothetical protein